MQCTGTFSANFLLSNPLPCNSVVFQPLGVKVKKYVYRAHCSVYIYISNTRDKGESCVSKL